MKCCSLEQHTIWSAFVNRLKEESRALGGFDDAIHSMFGENIPPGTPPLHRDFAELKIAGDIA